MTLFMHEHPFFFFVLTIATLACVDSLQANIFRVILAAIKRGSK